MRRTADVERGERRLANRLSSADLADVRSLGGRLIELERERSDAHDQLRLLTTLQNTFTTIAITRSPDEVIAAMLGAAHEPLGFDRAIYFNVDRRTGVEARWQIDRSDVVERSDEIADVRRGSEILSVLRGDSTAGVGHESELSAPLVDVRGWYILSPLVTSEGTVGLLYVDGHRSKAPRDSEIGLVRALTTVAAVAIDNSLLFAKTQELATRDPLTGLYNRRAFAERLMSEIATCRETGGALTYVIIDVDDFKRFNDTLGHAHGDTILKRLAETLLHSSRGEDVVGRFAGDEFVVLLVDVDPQLARTLVGRLSNDLKASGINCSLGAALFPRDASDPATLLAAADQALYATKAAGKNGFSFAEPAPTSEQRNADAR